MNFENFIDNKIKDKKILEIGGLGDYKKYDKNNFVLWRHHRVRKLSKELVGGDINENGIKFVNSKGYNFRYFNIENTNIVNETGKFEKILLLDVIEHLNNIGQALENIKNYMNEDSEFIISTPNIMSFNNIFRTILGKRINTLEDHTVWLDEINFNQLAKRYDFEIVYIQYFTFNPTANIKQRIVNFFGKLNKYFHQNFVVILKLKV